MKFSNLTKLSYFSAIFDCCFTVLPYYVETKYNEKLNYMTGNLFFVNFPV